METKNNFRTRVMKYAWQIRKAKALAWRLCLKLAWEIYHLQKQMKQRVVSFSYQKKDGTIRSARGTLADITTSSSSPKSKKNPFATVFYYDIDKQAFRCFKVENYLHNSFAFSYSAI